MDTPDLRHAAVGTYIGGALCFRALFHTGMVKYEDARRQLDLDLTPTVPPVQRGGIRYPYAERLACVTRARND